MDHEAHALSAIIAGTFTNATRSSRLGQKISSSTNDPTTRRVIDLSGKDLFRLARYREQAQRLPTAAMHNGREILLVTNSGVFGRILAFLSEAFLVSVVSCKQVVYNSVLDPVRRKDSVSWAGRGTRS